MTQPTPSPLIDRARAQAANARAMAALREGDAPAAILAAREAAHADPEALSLWINLALACRLGSDAQGEREALQRALDLDRLDFTAQLRMAQLLQREGEETKALIAWDGVQQLAQHFPGLPDPVRAELAAGEAYCAALRERIPFLSGPAVCGPMSEALGRIACEAGRLPLSRAA